jgi:hypothetical protein
MEGCRSGSDVWSYIDAKLLREVEAAYPEFIQIGPCAADIPGHKRQPYFGAILTPRGIHALAPEDYGVGVRILRAERAYQLMFEFAGCAWCGVVLDGIMNFKTIPELEAAAELFRLAGLSQVGLEGGLVPLTWDEVIEKGYVMDAEEQRVSSGSDRPATDAETATA